MNVLLCADTAHLPIWTLPHAYDKHHHGHRFCTKRPRTSHLQALQATKKVQIDRQSRRTQSGRNQRSFKGREEKKGSQFYFNFTGFPFPLGPLISRPTVRVEVALSHL